jgi:ATP-dependent Clp protease ATP-binding subunit ClpA
VGKNAIVDGLAQRLADGAAPTMPSDRRILAIDASSLLSDVTAGLAETANRANTILYIEGLFDLAGKSAGWNLLQAIHVLEPQLAHGGLQCIATGTPFGLRLTLERAEALAAHFEVVSVLPPSEGFRFTLVSQTPPSAGSRHRPHRRSGGTRQTTESGRIARGCRDRQTNPADRPADGKLDCKPRV